LWQDVTKHLEKAGHTVVMHDLRKQFARPRYDLMHGFRFSQRELLTEALEKRCSGLIVAPTRWGKTTLIKNTIRAFPGLCTVVTLPGIDLVQQMYEEIKQAFPSREVKMIGGGSKVRFPSEDITVSSMDSLEKCDVGRTDLLLVDEPHACVTNSRLPKVTAFDRARILGFSATPGGRFDGRDRITIGAIGPILAERTYPEAVAEGAICPLVVIFLRVNLDWTDSPSNRAKAYKRFLFESKSVAAITSRIAHEVIPSDWQSLIFIKNETQADLYLKHIGAEGTIAMAKRMTGKQRKAMFKEMQEDRVKRCLATNIYAQGVTFNNVRALINCEAGGNNTSAIQKPGRLAEIRPGKKNGIIFDFLFDAEGLDTTNLSDYDESHTWKYLARDSRAREKAYRDKGYDVRIVESFDQLKTTFNDLI
jgi:superfamily II DNA or RNA helicase